MLFVSLGSRDTSRETSPSRGTGSISRFRRGSDRPPLSPASRPVLAQKILQQSREAETALADAFVSFNFFLFTNKNMINMNMILYNYRHLLSIFQKYWHVGGFSFTEWFIWRTISSLKERHEIDRQSLRRIWNIQYMFREIIWFV